MHARPPARNTYFTRLMSDKRQPRTDKISLPHAHARTQPIDTALGLPSLTSTRWLTDRCKAVALYRVGNTKIRTEGKKQKKKSSQKKAFQSDLATL